MTSVAPRDKQPHQDLEAETQEAWSAYSDRLRELSGEEYEHAEAESWSELQRELERIERERELLAAGAR